VESLSAASEDIIVKYELAGTIAGKGPAQVGDTPVADVPFQRFIHSHSSIH
jgi:hypothetical protein